MINQQWSFGRLPTETIAVNDPADLSTSFTLQHIKRATLCGKGGFGEVFFLEHETLGKIAIKRLRERADFGAASDERRVSSARDRNGFEMTR